jgi:hypothetical protein
MPTPTMTVVRAGPRIATIASARRISGKASIISIQRMITVSAQPP